MIKGKVTGDYEYHYEFRGDLNIPIAQNRTYLWTTQLDLSKGLWIIQVFIHFSLRNLNMEARILAEGQIVSSSGVHNADSSPTLETVSLLSVFDNVRVISGNSQDLRIYLRGGIGGGEVKNTGIVVFAYKKQEPRKRKQLKKSE
jgi:hypothetical protein